LITRDTIEEIKSRIDIVDVVSDFVSLKRSGQNYRALSPFTSEKTPSFYVVPSKGIYKDFSSGKGGDGINFVMEHEGMSYPEALRYLALKYGIEIKEDYTQQKEEGPSQKESLHILMGFARDFYRDALKNTDDGRNIGMAYFRERGLNERAIDLFELGYSLPGWDELKKSAERSGFTEEALEKAGLIIKKEDGRPYDRFRGRVMFPVHNTAGKVIAFGARMLGKKKDQPKYINSPETEIYHKSSSLYGIWQAKNHIRREDNCYLVEGYMDVISLHLADVPNVVASSGTALTEDQVRLIRRYTENVTMLYDGDPAGIKAALRGVDLVLKQGLNVRVVALPEGEDPDSYSRRVGTTSFKEYLKSNTRDFISFKAHLVSREAGADPIRKAEAIRDMVTSIALIPDGLKRSVYLKETSTLMQVSETVLIAELNKMLIQEKRKKERDPLSDLIPVSPGEYPQPEPVNLNPEATVQVQEREAIRLLVNYADKPIENQRLAAFIVRELDEVSFTNPHYRVIFDTYKHSLDRGHAVDTFHLMENSGADERRIISELLTPRREISGGWTRYGIFVSKEEDDLTKPVTDHVHRFKFRLLQKMALENLEKIRQATSDDEVDQLLWIQSEIKSLDVQVAQELGIDTGRY
jgi:DNA primase